MPILGPFLLITAGVIFLLNNLDVLPWSIWSQLWKLWPLILILLGLEILLGRRSPALSLILIVVVLVAGVGFVYASGGFRDPGNLMQTPLNVQLPGGVSKVDVSIEMGVGRLNLDGDDVGSTQLATGTLGYFENQSKPVQTVDTSGDTAQLLLKQSDHDSHFFPFGSRTGSLTWDLHLNPDIPLKLKVETGAGEGNLDLEKLRVTNLELNSGVGKLTVTVPASGSTTGTIRVGWALSR